ncbi:SAG family member [Eimeria mitis]|uniref:SAG family member n=1 Tax=Eimeria mitis TaxID=44415 RepID=U6JUI8_9EIME|nr:SAG family member [Eimeria mitis]CDJ27732.1 SAG family member [Eimeria mitis]
MPALRLLTVVSASLLLLARADGGDGQSSSATTKYKVTLGTDDACLSEINNARKDVGFNDFVAAKQGEQGKTLPEADTESPTTENWVWKPVCDVLIPEDAKSQKSEGAAEKKFASGTYAFQVVSAPNPDCTAVVDTWKKAHSNFSGVPPSKKDSNTLYDNHENVSFVAIYNPSEGATAHCRVVTCTKKITPGPAAPQGEPQEEDTTEEETKEGSALICMTTPDVLPEDSKTAPFTEEQWGRIVTVLEGSASTVFPTVLGIITAVFAVVAAM